MSQPAPKRPEANRSGSHWLEVVRTHVESLRFGAVEIVVHEGRVIQIERTERVRLAKNATPANEGNTPVRPPQGEATEP